jgi:hypothetical protein
VLKIEAKEQVIGIREGYILREFVIILVIIIIIELAVYILAIAITILIEVIVLRDRQLVKDRGEVVKLTR